MRWNLRTGFQRWKIESIGDLNVNVLCVFDWFLLVAPTWHIWHRWGSKCEALRSSTRQPVLADISFLEDCRINCAIDQGIGWEYPSAFLLQEQEPRVWQFIRRSLCKRKAVDGTKCVFQMLQWIMILKHWLYRGSPFYLPFAPKAVYTCQISWTLDEQPFGFDGPQKQPESFLKWLAGGVLGENLGSHLGSHGVNPISAEVLDASWLPVPLTKAP